MRLREFQGSTARTQTAIAMGLQGMLGKLIRVGGSRRFYEVGGGHELAAVYLIDGTEKAFGLAWTRDLGAAGVSTVYVWNKFDINLSPDYLVSVPTTGEMSEIIPALAAWIKSPTTGTVSEGEEEITEAKRTTDQDFMRMTKDMFPSDANNMTWPQIMQVAQKNDVQVPTSIRSNPNLKIDAHHWNLSGGEAGGKATDAELSTALGGPVEKPEPATLDPVYHDALELAKAKTVSRMASSGKLYLMGRTAKGAWFRVPGIEELTAKLERMLSRQMEAHGGSDRLTMEDQYNMLKEKVKLVAGGKAAFIKSLLITGAPSSGKTFVVMQTLIKELGLKPGEYVVKKGRITALSMYRTLIENIDGLLIFDDCDSVVDDKNGVNMLKGALDTDAVREVSYDVRGTMNTAVMTPARRDEVVDAISRILRGEPESGDLDMFKQFLKKKKEKKPTRGGDQDEDEIEDEDSFDDFNGGIDDVEDEWDADYHEKLHETQQYLIKHLPNKIDFRGRIIFISNMGEDEWDSAILTRAFAVNMQFTSGEMLDYIDKIKGHLKTPNLTEEQKQEVMDYLRDLYTTGKLKRQVNFRLVQQAFDLRLASNWKQMVSML